MGKKERKKEKKSNLFPDLNFGNERNCAKNERHQCSMDLRMICGRVKMKLAWYDDVQSLIMMMINAITVTNSSKIGYTFLLFLIRYSIRKKINF